MLIAFQIYNITILKLNILVHCEVFYVRKAIFTNILVPATHSQLKQHLYYNYADMKIPNTQYGREIWDYKKYKTMLLILKLFLEAIDLMFLA